MGDIVGQIMQIQELIKTLLPVLGMAAILMAGGLYAFGQMSGSDDARARMKSWAQRVGIGGAVAIIIGVASPAILTWLQGF